LYAWDNDGEHQISNALNFALMQDPEDRGVRIFIPVQDLTQIEDQLSNQVQFKTDALSDEQVEFILLPMGWDTDADQQISNQVNFKSDDVIDSGVEQIVLPYNDWSTDADNQRLNPLSFGQDTLSDEGVEYIIIPAIPTVAYDNDSDNQRPTPLQFSSDTLSDEIVEQIFLPYNDFTLDADQQLAQPLYQGVWSDAGEWLALIILPPGTDIRGWEYEQNQFLQAPWSIEYWENNDLLRFILPTIRSKKPSARVFGVQGTSFIMRGGIGTQASTHGKSKDSVTSGGDEGTQASVDGKQKNKGNVEN
jgi:hypothetical protein